MKLIKAGAEQFVFQLEPKEKPILLKVLGLYPLIPVSHQRLSKSNECSEGQQLLEEAMAAQHKEKFKNLIENLLQSGALFREHEEGWRFFLKSLADLEWLLQVLNDVRVGSWLIIGSPDGPTEMLAALNEKTAPYFWALQVADHFEIALLQALREGGAETGNPK